MIEQTRKLGTKNSHTKSARDNVVDRYPDIHSHLLDELRWLNRLIAARVMELRFVNFYESIKDFRGFFIADEEIDALLAAGVFERNGTAEDAERETLMHHLLQQAKEMRQQISLRADYSRTNNIILPLLQLAHIFHLHELERQVLLICLAPQIDARYAKLYAYLQNDISKRAPSIDLILSLLCHSFENRIQFLPYFEAGAPLRHYRLIELVENGSGLSAGQHFLRADARILSFILGSGEIDARIQPYVCLLPPVSWQNVIVPAALQKQLQKIFQCLCQDMPGCRSVLHFYGRPGVGKKTLARALCGEMGVELAVVDIRPLWASPDTFIETIRLILRESLLQPCAVYFDHLEVAANGTQPHAWLLSQLAQEVREMGWLTFLGSEHPLQAEWLEDLPVLAVEIPAADFTIQKKLWTLHLEGRFASRDDADLDALVAQFDLTPDQIAGAVQMAEQQALARGAKNGLVDISDLIAACRRQSQPAFGRLAQKIPPLYTWEDIVLPEDVRAQLQEICQRVRHRQRVWAEWGFDRKLSQGKGVNALFAGPSGTGKTMAAEVIANELGLDLYKIDLSGVVSKYIGETEKNLDRIFSAAEHANAILFFDEADALFGKRSEVRDSHDRYANIEISYLLQKMEQYQGIAILATNLRQNLDESFVRRLAFTVNFPFPDEASRLRIWQGIWPEATPRSDDVDLSFLAKQFKLSGGNIKNAVLAAAFLAAEHGSEVRMAHLLQAIRREYQKMGKVIEEAELVQHTG